MTEPPALVEARRCLARAETDYRAAEALAELERGLDLLEEVASGAAARHRTIARNLCATYRDRLYRRVDGLLNEDPAVPEPELEHLLKLVFAFDGRPVDESADSAKTLKLELVRRLIERYYEGHPADRKQRALEQLAALAADERQE